MRATYLLLAIVLLVSMVGCGARAPEPLVPKAVSAEPCRVNGTGTLDFVNSAESDSGESMEIELDGARLNLERPPLQPGRRTFSVVVAAGIPHMVRFHYARNGQVACAESYPIPPVCGSLTLTCRGNGMFYWRN